MRGPGRRGRSIDMHSARSAMSGCWTSRAVPPGGAGLAQSGGQVLKTLTNRVDAGLFTTTGVTNGRPVGVFRTGADGELVGECGRCCGATYAAYRVLNGAVTLQPAGDCDACVE